MRLRGDGDAVPEMQDFGVSPKFREGDCPGDLVAFVSLPSHFFFQKKKG